MSDGFSTLEVAPGERFDFWREMIRRHFVPLQIEPLVEGEFNGSVRLRSLGDLDVARVRADPMRAGRGWRHIERSASDEYFIGLHLRGVAVGEQSGRRAILRPGDFALFDSALPYRIDFRSTGPFEHLILRIPRGQLDSRCANLERATGVAVAAASPGGRLASSSLAAFAEVSDGEQFQDPVLDLLARALTLAGGSGSRLPVSREARALEQLKRFARSYHADTELAPARVAAACFVSVRQLHRLFSRDGTSFGAFLRETRLDHCGRDLGDPALAQLAIGQIARRHGFRSAATFTRAFTDRYGCGPRAFRSGAGGGAAPTPAGIEPRSSAE